MTSFELIVGGPTGAASPISEAGRWWSPWPANRVTITRDVTDGLCA
jgi:hypothetical protein